MSFAFLSPILNFSKYSFSSAGESGFGNPLAVFMYEEKRVNYVAATRAKELLVWCTTPKKAKKKYDVESWD